MTEDESTEIQSVFENWSTLRYLRNIILLIVAVRIVVALYCFIIASISWMACIDSIEDNVIIVPALIGLMLQSNKTIKRMVLNNNVFERFISAFIIKYFAVKRVSEFANLPFKALIIIFILNLMMHIDMLLTRSFRFRTIEAAFLSLMVLTASFNHLKFTRRSICVAIFASCPYLCFIFPGYLIDASYRCYEPHFLVSAFGCVLFMLYFSFHHDLHSHQIVDIAIVLSTATFAFYLVLPFYLIPADFTFFSLLLQEFLLFEVYIIYILFVLI